MRNAYLLILLGFNVGCASDLRLAPLPQAGVNLYLRQLAASNPEASACIIGRIHLPEAIRHQASQVASTVKLIDAISGATLTAQLATQDGEFAFYNIPPGRYRLAIVAWPLMLRAEPSHEFALSPGQKFAVTVRPRLAAP